jgi:(S)-2-hydroxyglutarate dehydrogenase
LHTQFDHGNRYCKTQEVGPNAVPVFSPYAYSLGTNIRYLKPKLIETSRTGGRKIFFDRQFLLLASSISKTAMINRARNFLPQLRPSAFMKRHCWDKIFFNR